MNPERLPNCFLIGASKSGTTTLYDVLKRHHHIYLSYAKEPMFFSHDEYFQRGLSWYTDIFFSGAESYPIRIDASTHYLYWSEKVAPRIKEMYKEDEIKFVAIFRDPVERAYSWYWHMVRECKEELPFDKALDIEAKRLAENWAHFRYSGAQRYGYYYGGCYASLLKPFIESFPRENFHFMLHEDLQNEFDASIARLLDFFGISSEVDLQRRASNVASMPRSRKLHDFLLRPYGLGQRILKLFTQHMSHGMRHRLKMFLLRANLRRESYPPMPKDVAHALRARFAPEVKQLEATISRDLSHWYRG